MSPIMFVSGLVLLSSRILVSHASEDICKMRSSCLVTCADGHHSQVPAAINAALRTLADPELCYSSIKLVVTIELLFNNHTIPCRWLPASGTHPLSVIELSVDLTDIWHIASEAFDTPLFRGTRQMELHGLHDRLALGAAAFAGMTELHELRLRYNRAHMLPRLLDTLELLGIRMLYIHSEPYPAEPLDLAPLTSSAYAHTIQYMSVITNLRFALGSQTLSGLRGAEKVSLGHCDLMAIAPRAFDAMSGTLRWLSLEGNTLLTLPVGLFAAIANWQLVRIHVEYNWWMCDCHLRDLQNYMRMYPSSFAGAPLCTNPAELNGQLVESSVFCENTVADQWLRCDGDGQSVYVQNRSGAMRIVRPVERSALVSIDFGATWKWPEYVSVELYMQLGGGAWRKNCVHPAGAVNISQWLEKVNSAAKFPAYLVCVCTGDMFIPLNCVPVVQYQRANSRAWIAVNRRTIFEFLLILVLIMSFLLGFIAVLLAYKRGVFNCTKSI